MAGVMRFPVVIRTVLRLTNSITTEAFSTLLYPMLPKSILNLVSGLWAETETYNEWFAYACFAWRETFTLFFVYTGQR